MTENANHTLALEARTEYYQKLIPAAVRKAIIECVADLADEVAPEQGPSWSAYSSEDELDREAFDAAIDEFTDHLKKTLLLDPEPWQHYLGGRAEHLPDINGWSFKPRAFFSQNEEDYS